jgi:hypothetical protein
MNIGCDIRHITAGCVIVIVCITLFLTVHRNFDNIEYMIPGFYVAPHEFCVGAGLDAFLMYIGEKQLVGKTRKGYILATQGDKMIINSPIEFCISWDWLSWNNWLIMLRHSSPIDGVIKFKDEIKGIPQKMTVLAYPTYGKIVLSHGDTIYATLYRNAELTEKITKKIMTDHKISSADMLQNKKVEVPSIAETKK